MPPAKPLKNDLIGAPYKAPRSLEGLFAGTSGWAYPTWKPDFYPQKLPAKSFLAYYATQVNSVEVNYTFRTLPTEKILQGWLDQTPASFRFSFKAPQRITHFSRLRDCDALLAQFLASLNPAALAGKLGLLLFQLPPNFKADLDRLSSFLSSPAFRSTGPARIAFEFRHESWFADNVYRLLREHNASLCVADTDDLKTPEVLTAGDHVAFRLRRHGGYTDDELAGFATRFSGLAQERDVYAYFRHEDEPTGAQNATRFLSQAAALQRNGAA